MQALYSAKATNGKSLCVREEEASINPFTSASWYHFPKLLQSTHQHPLCFSMFNFGLLCVFFCGGFASLLKPDGTRQHMLKWKPVLCITGDLEAAKASIGPLLHAFNWQKKSVLFFSGICTDARASLTDVVRCTTLLRISLARLHSQPGINNHLPYYNSWTLQLYRECRTIHSIKLLYYCRRWEFASFWHENVIFGAQTLG